MNTCLTLHPPNCELPGCGCIMANQTIDFVYVIPYRLFFELSTINTRRIF